MADERRDESRHDGDDEERRRMEEEIEEILRRKGEQPGRARRPSRRPGLPPVPPRVTNALSYVLMLAGAAVLVFLSLRVLGPAGLRLAVTAALVFLFFFTIRGLLMDIIRRRRSR